MSEFDHRQKKRKLEMELIVGTLRSFLPANPLEILEFGAGAGSQIPFLQKLGSVTASDIVLDPALKRVSGLQAVECSIARTPFEDSSFDIIFSNHVIEHLEDAQAAFAELKRIGKPECVYAFSVPTHLWLMLSIPAQYWSRLRRLWSPPERVSQGGGERASQLPGSEASVSQKKTFLGRLADKLLPRGHGIEEDFGRCYQQFKISTWKEFFSRYGFAIEKIKPLLLYGPSEFPVIPTLPASSTGGLCSSVLFILKSKAV